MRKLAKEILGTHDSYIDALQSAITVWNNAKTGRDKRDYMVAIGEIGREIHGQNLALDIANMKVDY
jgi:hypothetical protein